MNNPVIHLLRAIAMGSAAFLAQSALSAPPVVGYDNLTTYSGVNFNYANISPNPDNYNGEAGNQVLLAGTLSSYTVTEVDVQFDFVNSLGTIAGSPAGGEKVQLSIYPNTGPVFGTTTYNSPNSTTPLYQSPLEPLAGFTYGNLAQFTGLDVVGVPQSFTWTLSFSGLSAGETAGLDIFGPAPSVGQNYNDSWINTTGGWTLETATGSTPLDYGAEVDVTSVPEPSTIALGIAGACALLAARRKK